MAETFRALVLDQQDGNTTSRFEDLPLSALPEGDVLVEVAYSTLNYKDGLAITGEGKIVRESRSCPGSTSPAACASWRARLQGG